MVKYMSLEGQDFTRGEYNELVKVDVKLAVFDTREYPTNSKRLKYLDIMDDLRKDNPDEWSSMCDYDRKGRGQSLNFDLYGASEFSNLYIIQVRQSVRQRRSWYLEVRKSYFLIGRNENGNAFSHCVSYAPVQAAIRKNPGYIGAAVDGALKWIWGTSKFCDIIRHGDVALLPVKRVPIDAVKQDVLVLDVEKSHTLLSNDIRISGKVYAYNATLTHKKNQHGDVKCNGWAQVLVGRRERPWDFAKQTID